MKRRLIAVLLLLVTALTACTPAGTLEKEGKDPNRPHPTRVTKATEATELTEATEATEIITEATTDSTEAPTQESPDADMGTFDGNRYKNDALGIACSLPESWYVYNGEDIARLNNLVAATFDHTAIADAIEVGQSVIIFCASEPATISSVQIGVSKNLLPGVDEAALINASAPLVKSQLEQTGIQNVACNSSETDFCGQKHTVLTVNCEAGGMQLYETIVYLPRGNLLYTVTVSTALESMVAETLGMFEPLK